MARRPVEPRRQSTAPTRRPARIETLTVRRHGDGWRLLVDHLQTPAWTVTTKRRAVQAAKATARELHTRLVIETASGTIHQTHDFTRENA